MRSILTHHPPSPIQELTDERLITKGIRLLVKRDDLLRLNEQSAFCGNKWRKLKYNLQEAHRRGLSILLSFGGAFSNHLAALAEAGQAFDFQTIGIVRGEKISNSTLRFCEQCGMHLHFMDRETYRQKEHPDFLEKLQEQFGDFYLLPEGGTNELALQGCAEIMSEVQEYHRNEFPDFIATACGTGGTLAGIVQGLKGQSQAIGFSVLKGNFLQQEVEKLLSKKSENPLSNWQIQSDYHFGGYAKFSSELIDFMNDFKKDFGIQLDPIYTGKLFFGLFDLIQKDFFTPGSIILAVHTGGLQGIEGFNERFGDLIS
ncbi:MAG: 1-aminocyclopropane-1-carboxylate deaminase/D-cysteine desulfhydrase [Saprospiraceae bacterium]|nr:1-aminocyclopropane-1-carboxylate deaminase/D-cysteine desulfhydrase [Saprospiraceae bacterium]